MRSQRPSDNVPSHGGDKRRGIIAPLTALFLIFLLGMVAFGVDVGWIVLSQTNLQNSADAAALAGAQPLMDGYVQYQLTSDATTKTTILNNTIASAKTYAKNYASYNSAGSVSGLVLQDADIECGFLDSSNVYTAGPPYTNFPNTVKVVLRLDSTANGALGLYFGPVVGTSSVNLTATASATIYAGTINSFNKSSINTGMLPLTYDKKDWDNFLQTGKDPHGNGLTDGSGVPQLQIFKESNYQLKGNFAWLSLNDSHASANDLRGWIDSGMSSSDTQALMDGQLIPLDNGVNQNDWRGTPGDKASAAMAVNDYVGKSFVLPLFWAAQYDTSASVSTNSNYKAGVGQGSNYDYNIVQFVGVKVMYTSDANKEIIVQPSAVIDPNAVFSSGTLVPAGSGSSTTLVTTFSTPKLTR